MNQYLGFVLKGLAMGAANVIPGVSGGTIAFVTGIYQRLIDGLKSFDLGALKLLLTGHFKVFVLKTDLYFLLSIFLGVGVSILSLAKVVELAFLNYETFTLAFFFGLIIASILGVGRQISVFSSSNIFAILLGTAIAAGIAFLPPAEPNSSMLYLILCGAVAICSMILPGLSGSYILLLMGNYILVMKGVSTLNFGILMPIAIGCIAGLVLFSRLLSYLFNNYADFTISILTGFVAGSLAIIWPWKVTNYAILESGKQKAIGYSWHLPELDGVLAISLGLMLFGFLLVWFMERMASNKPS
ncbi:MAG: putative membrane protein [Marinoscillum sp.]|jgi:putative membrane protein